MKSCCIPARWSALDQNFFLVDGKPLPIVGTTYMASDVQRQYLMQPNPFVWDRDFAQMHDNGINMIRTGLWTAWDQVMKEPGVVQDSALRNLEAFLLTARRYNIPVQFTLLRVHSRQFRRGQSVSRSRSRASPAGLTSPPSFRASKTCRG